MKFPILLYLATLLVITVFIGVAQDGGALEWAQLVHLGETDSPDQGLERAIKIGLKSKNN